MSSDRERSVSHSDTGETVVTIPIVKVAPIVEFGGLLADDAVIKSASDVERDECRRVDDGSDVTTLSSLWLKGLAAATIYSTGIMFLCLLLFRDGSRYTASRLPDDPYLVAGSAIFGAAICGLDLMGLQSRLGNQNSVTFSFRLWFALGLGILLVVWTFATTKFWLSILVG